MGRFVLRRLIQSVFTVFGVMLLTFLLFRVVAGDVSAQYVNPKLGREARLSFLRKHQLDWPLLLNLQRRLVLSDTTKGDRPFSVQDANGSKLAAVLIFERRAMRSDDPNGPYELVSQPVQPPDGMSWLGWMNAQTPLKDLTGGSPWLAKRRAAPAEEEAPAPPPPAAGPAAPKPPSPAPPRLVFHLRDGSRLEIDLKPLADSKAPAVGTLMDLVNDDPLNAGRVAASFSAVNWRDVTSAQFFKHLWSSVTFDGHSYKTAESLTDIIWSRGGYSLAIQIPALALGWLTGMIVSCFVAYYRDTWIDKVGVLLSVLGMCVPYLAYMILGQELMFRLAPESAWGLRFRANIYVPVGIAVVAGLGGSVRFYRTIILDQINSDYVRTARAKGAPLTSILFKHVIKNCMLPILTNLVLAIPFLILGSLLLERFFGVAGLGDLMISSISDRDVPIITGLTFLTAIIYVIGLLITDLLYAVFDPRIRLH